MLLCPMSSPQMMTMFGFLSAAAAGEAEIMAAHTKATIATAANHLVLDNYSLAIASSPPAR